MGETMSSADYIAALDEMYRNHYTSGICPYYDECFASAGSGPKFTFDYATKIGSKYGEPGNPKILIVGQEGKTGHQEVGKTTESIDSRSGANNDHYRKTLYTLALLFGKDIPLSYAYADLVTHEDLLQRFCLTNYFKCAISGETESDCRGLHHTRAMKDNCYHLLEKEIDILEPDIVVIQGKFTPPPFWTVYGEGVRINGNRTKEDDTLSLYCHKHKSGKPFYILYSYHPCYFRAWSGELLEQFHNMIRSFLNNRAKENTQQGE